MKTRTHPSELKTWLDTGRPVQVLDVRGPDEHADWHIPGAVNVPLDELPARLGELDRDRPVVVVCTRGVRSAEAAELVRRSGLEATSLDGGMLAWNGVYETHPLKVDGPFTVLQVRRVGKGCVSHVVLSGDRAVVVDPTVDVDVFERLLHDHGAEAVAVLDTHAHADHVSGARTLAKRLGAPYLAPAEVGERDGTLRPGTSVPVGETRVDVLATPGHTPGSLSFRVGTVLFTGDTLFVDGVGRPDLGQDARTTGPVLWRTLREGLAALPGSTLVLPSHVGGPVEGPAVARLGDLRASLEAFAFDEATFVAWVASNRLPPPENFQAIKRVNVGGAPYPTLEDARELEAGANRCAVTGAPP